MIDLILTVCLTANPSNCRDEHLYFQSDGSLMTCIWHAPMQIAKWSDEHPAVQVVRWKCSFPEKGRDI